MTCKSTTAPPIRNGLTGALCAVILSGGLMVGLSRTASAQYAFEEEMLPPRVVAWRLSERGFSGLSRPRFDGRVYVVEAVSPNGVPVRLFVDPAVGAIVGRQRLGGPETYARLERPAPGFGWTDEDAAPRRALRPLPQEDFSGPAARPVRRPGPEAARPEANPSGVNPDAAARPEAPRKVARAAAPPRQPELKPALRDTPAAPAPRIAPAAKADPKPEAKPEAPAAATGTGAPQVKPAEGARAEAAKPLAQDWKDPSAEKRPVRVIGGATIVPGTAEKESGEKGAAAAQ